MGYSAIDLGSASSYVDLLGRMMADQGAPLIQRLYVLTSKLGVRQAVGELR